MSYASQAYDELLRLEKKYAIRISNELKSSLREIEGKMQAIYKKYAKDGELTLAQMTQYNRYMQMEASMLAALEPAIRDNIKQLTKMRPEQYGEAFFHSAWAIDQQTGLRLSWGMTSPKAIISLFSLTNPANKYFKEALKHYDANARKIIKETLKRGLIQGISYDNMVKELSTALQITEGRALRILRTEGQTSINAGQALSYKQANDQGVLGNVVWDATLDNRTRPDHGAMDGKSKGTDGWYRPGPGGYDCPYPAWEGLPAKERIHCRCTEHFQVEGFTPLVRRTREEGLVPYQTYEEWKKGVKLWEGYTPPKVTPSTPPVKKVRKPRAITNKNVTSAVISGNVPIVGATPSRVGFDALTTFGEKTEKKAGKAAYDKYRNYVSESAGTMRDDLPDQVYASIEKTLKRVKFEIDVENHSYFSPSEAKIYINGDFHDPKRLRTFRHELGHAVHDEWTLAKVGKNTSMADHGIDGFNAALKKDMEYMKDRMSAMKAAGFPPEFIDVAEVSDVMDGINALYPDQLWVTTFFGHSKSYWLYDRELNKSAAKMNIQLAVRRDDNTALYHEAFAHVFSLYTKKDSLAERAYFRKYFSNIYDYIKGVIEGGM